jgi:hypothetical protein
VTAENARMSLEDEVDQATAKAIGSADPTSGARPAPAPAGSNGPGRNGPPGPGPSPSPSVGTGAPRPAAPTVVADTPLRPAPGSQTQPSPQIQAPPAHQDKPSQARATVADPGPSLRDMPGTDDD